MASLVHPALLLLTDRNTALLLPFRLPEPPLTSDGEAVYFCGNSLGLLSKRGRKLIMEELDTWSTS